MTQPLQQTAQQPYIAQQPEFTKKPEEGKPPQLSTLSQSTGKISPRLSQNSTDLIRQKNVLEGTKDFYVGPVGKDWTLASDHAPAGASLVCDETGEIIFNIASYNTLNTNFLKWTINEKDEQGLNGSLIDTAHNEPSDFEGVTKREAILVEEIQKMLNHNTHPRSLIALQECGPAFLGHLSKKIGSDFKIVYCSPDLKSYGAYNQNVVIYNSKVIEYIEEESQMIPQDKFFTLKSTSPIMDLTFVHKKEKYRIFNMHLPGKPGNPAPEELAKHLKSAIEKDPKGNILVLADMNTSSKELSEPLQKANIPDLQHVAPYKTIINYQSLTARDLDQFVAYCPGKTLVPNKPDQVIPGLKKVTDLLRPRSPIEESKEK